MAGLGSFIEGAFQGYEYGEKVKDRKTQRKRNDKRWEWEQESRDVQRENQDWTRENRDYTRTQRERQMDQWQRAEDDREAIAGIYTDARESYGADGQPETESQPRTSSRSIMSQPAAEQPPEAAPQRPQMRPRSIAQQPSVSSEGPQQPMAASNGQPPQAPGPEQGAAPAAPAVPPGPAAMPQPGRSVRGSAGTAPTGPDAPMPRSFAENPRARQAAQQVGIGIEQLWAGMRPEDQQLFAQMDGQQTPTPPQTRPTTPGGQRPQMAAQQPPAPQAPSGMTARRDGPIGPGPTGGTPGPARPGTPEQPAPDQQRPAAPARPGAPGAAPKAGNLDVREASTAELDQQATQNPPGQGGAPSVTSASAAMQDTQQASRGVMGNGDVNPADEERASQTFMQHYAETAVPKIIDHFLKQGDVEKATAFQEWADSQKVKGQMASWSKAIWAITNGDEDRFIEHLSATYNAIDDGMSIDPEQTRFKHDRQGNITGATLAVRNDETGEVSVQEYDNQQDIVEMAVYTLAPEQTFEYLWGLSQQAREMRMKNQRSAVEPIDRMEMAQEIRREADSIRTSQEFNTDKMTEDQIEEIARQNVYRRLGMSAGASTGQGGGAPQQEPPRLQ